MESSEALTEAGTGGDLMRRFLRQGEVQAQTEFTLAQGISHKEIEQASRPLGAGRQLLDFFFVAGRSCSDYQEC